VAWQVVAGRLVIAYEHPDGDDPLVARIVTILAAALAYGYANRRALRR
jgi:hypothetical protein